MFIGMWYVNDTICPIVYVSRKLNQPEKAEGFLLDALKMYKQENWYILADNTSLDIARCQKLLNNDLK